MGNNDQAGAGPAPAGELLASPGARAEAFTFGDPIPVLDGREILDYLECYNNGRWYEPPVSLDGLARSSKASVYLQSGLIFKRNALARTFKPHKLLSRQAFEQIVMDLGWSGNLFMYAPNGKKDGIQLIPISEVAAKDDFGAIKNISRDDQLAMLRIPPQLMGVVPQNAGGFGSVRDATQVWAINELEPEQARLLQINDWLGEEVIRFQPYDLPAGA